MTQITRPNPLKLNPLQLKTLVLFQELARHLETATRLDNGEVAWSKPYSLAAVQTNNSPGSIDSDDVGVYVAGYMEIGSADAGVADRTIVVRFDANTGDEVWHTTVPFGSEQGFGRSPRLVIDDLSVYVSDANRNGSTTLAKLSKADGMPEWSTSSFPQGAAPGEVVLARSGRAILAAGRSAAPDAGSVSIDTQLQVEKREAATGAFSAANHLELTQ